MSNDHPRLLLERFTKRIEKKKEPTFWDNLFVFTENCISMIFKFEIIVSDLRIVQLI